MRKREPVQLIQTTGASCVCFDAAQTLLVRPWSSEDDLYVLMEHELRDLLHTTDVPAFAELRREAERMAARGAQGTPSLEAIYQALSELCGADVTALWRKERERRMRHVQPRAYGQRCWQEARKANKTILVAVDTALDRQAVVDMLAQAGFDGYDGLYLSSEAGKTLAEGALFAHMAEKHGGPGVYLGPCADAACRAGWRSARVASPYEVFRASGLYRNVFEKMSTTASQSEAVYFVGVRCMLAMVANKAYDDPAREPMNDFGGDIDLIGYGALGMYVAAQALWLLKEAREERYDTIGFLARDGYLICEAFEKMRAAFGVTTAANYLRISRKSVFPLHFQRREDFLSLPNLTDMRQHSAQTLMALFANVIPSEKQSGMEAAFARAGIPYGEPFGTVSNAFQAVRVFVDELYDPQAFEAYRARALAYLSPMLYGKCATFDVGYSVRAEAVLCQLTHTRLTAYFTHTDHDIALRRAECAGVRVRTLMNGSPYVSWLVREQFLTESSPSCTGYDEAGQPVMEEEKNDAAYCGVIGRMQEDALLFADDLLRLFGDDLPHLYSRPINLCALFEYYLHQGKGRDTDALRKGNTDNSFMTGSKEMKCYSLWKMMQSDFAIALHGGNYVWRKAQRMLILLRDDRGLLRQRLLKRLQRLKP